MPAFRAVPLTALSMVVRKREVLQLQAFQFIAWFHFETPVVETFNGMNTFRITLHLGFGQNKIA